jgi:hypothetical protein
MRELDGGMVLRTSIFTDDIYIGNELYTTKEIYNQNLNINFLEKIEIKQNKTYFCFGARFEITT